ncbi:hypothetical protein CDAR_66341 [Caerostris darwini]|uniref:Uncharacterized protein n=1 Tax=Caerostris darwini TaxID=1538125 RepID=A0AAV4S1V7_9ARAC|nr:hypothetical protein CDAR_66341 [Caerostris darwini]
MKLKNFLYVVCVLIPFVSLPLALSSYKELRCTYVMIIMASFWLLEPAPIAATALLPIVLFPLLGVESFMMFIGSLIMAVAVEECRLHERIALKTILFIGAELKWLMLGFMLPTMVLSMWINNTATTAMMVPIVNAIVGKITLSSDNNEIQLEENTSLTESKQVNNTEKEEKSANSNKKQDDPKTEEVRLVLLLSVCYAANIGGLGTLIGTGPNLVFKGMLAELHPASTEVTFTTWMMYNTPGMVLCVLIAWFYLWMLYVRGQKIRVNNESKEKIFAIISERYDTLGSITPHETSVLVLFSILVCLLVFRDPKFMPGWEALLGLPKKIGDSAPAMAVAFLLFFLPSNLRDLNSPPILKWKSVQAKLPWGYYYIIWRWIWLSAWG